MAMGDGPNDAGLSRHHLIRACEASLRRLGTDHIDLFQVHEWDGVTPMEETLRALDDLVRAGKVRYVGLLELRGLADVEGARRLGAPRARALRQPAGLLLAAVPRRGVRDRAGEPRPGRRHPRLEPARRRAAVGQVPPRAAGPRGRAAPDGLERAARPRRGADLRRDRGGGRDRRGARRLRRAGRARVAARAPRRELARDRRAHRGAAGRQPRGGGPGAVSGRARPARRAERAPADLPPLAPGQDVGRPARAGRPRLARPRISTRASAPAGGRSRG